MRATDDCTSNVPRRPIKTERRYRDLLELELVPQSNERSSYGPETGPYGRLAQEAPVRQDPFQLSAEGAWASRRRFTQARQYEETF